MMRLVKFTMAGLVSILALLMIFLLLQPAAITIEKSVQINAQPEEAFDLLADIKNWETWSLWSTYQPENLYAYTENSVRWEGIRSNDINGSCQITAIDSLQQMIVGRLFFETQDTADFSLLVEPAGNEVQISWTYNQPVDMNPMTKIKSMLAKGVIEQVLVTSLDSLKATIERP